MTVRTKRAIFGRRFQNSKGVRIIRVFELIGNLPYVVCWKFYQEYFVLLYPWHTKYVGVYSFLRFSVWYIRSFIHLSVTRGQSFCVKVYKTSYFEDSLMDFIHIWPDGRYRYKVFISTIPTQGWPWGQGHGIFIKSKFFVVYVYILYHEDLWEISFIFDMLVDIGLESYSAHPHPRCDRGQGHRLKIFI